MQGGSLVHGHSGQTGRGTQFCVQGAAGDRGVVQEGQPRHE